MKNVLFILFALFSFFSIEAKAQLATGTVEVLYPSAPSQVYFRLKGDVCTSPEYFKFSLDTEEGKAWYAMLLAAATTGKPVKVSLYACPIQGNGAAVVRYIFQEF